MTQAVTDWRKDRFNLSLILFYSMGTLTQVSSSFILNAQMYWKYKFRDTDRTWDPASESPNDLQREFTADFSLVGNVTPLVSICLAVIFARKWNMTYRILVCFSIYISIFLLIILFALLDTDSWQRELFYTTIILVVLITCNSSLFLVTLLHMCSKFPPVYLAAMMSGQAMCGIFSSSVQILTLVVNGFPTTNGLLYFSVAIFCIIGTLMIFLITHNYSTFFQHQMKQIVVSQRKEVNMNKTFVFSVFKRQKFIFISLFLVAGATTMIQPGVTSTIRSVDAGKSYEWNDTYFGPVITFLAYFICDLSGRELAMRIGKPLNNVAVLVFSVCRIALVPLLLMCNLTVKINTPVIFNSDIVYIILQLLLGITNGFGLNICIVTAPRNFKNPEEETTIAVALLAAIIILGDAIAAPIGLLLVKIL